jgi:hypothetical protein
MRPNICCSYGCCFLALLLLLLMYQGVAAAVVVAVDVLVVVDVDNAEVLPCTHAEKAVVAHAVANILSLLYCR